MLDVISMIVIVDVVLVMMSGSRYSLVILRLIVSVWKWLSV